MVRILYIAIVVLVGCSPVRTVSLYGPTGTGPTLEPVQISDESAEPFDRVSWGRWADADKDCQNTRQEVLIRDSLVVVTFKDSDRCVVASGEWICPYTGERFTDPRDLDIDHIVPLKEAHESGGFGWDLEHKKNYFNYIDGLWPASASANRSKGAREPHEWLPAAGRCSYLSRWVRIKRIWGLYFDQIEISKLVEIITEECM